MPAIAATAEIWDRTNGRIYRVRYSETDTKPFQLAQLSDQQLVRLMLHENEWYVRTARRLLQQRAASGDLDMTVAREELRDIAFGSGDVTGRLRAVWTLHVCGLLADEDISKLLAVSGHKSEYLRSWAVQLDLEDRQTKHLGQLAQMSHADRSPLVRLYLAAALQRLPLSDRWEIATGLVRHADDTDDHNLPLMIWYGIEPLVTDDTPRSLELANSSRIPLVRRYIYRRAAADERSLGELLKMLSSLENVEREKQVLGEIATVVKTRGRIEMPTAWPKIFDRLAVSDDAQVREHALMISVKFGDASVFPRLRKLAADVDLTDASRISAINALAAGKDPQLPPLLIALLDEQPLRTTALRAMAGYSDDSVTAAILAKYATFGPTAKTDAVLTMSARVDSALQLLDAVDQQRIPQSDVSAFAARQMMLLDDDKLNQKLNRVWGTLRQSDQQKQSQIARFKSKLTPKVLRSANLSAGRLVYDNLCGKCHKLFGSGGDIGPDITGSNRGDLDYTLHNMIDPNALIGKDYQATKLLTEDGRLVVGLVKDENETAVVIQTANEKLVVEKEQIASRSLSATSMMPEGQLETLSDTQIRDLVAYLASPVQVALPPEG